ncbi:MAG: hypothetical protein PHH68_07335 [Candidatus Omnitrophica bacterium]|nr:hypothetical protein [Candidatus Omnitrophota bacterium]MDD5080110.1 hypothetical protein [Candidatus Omnitrophota bacterium]
MNKKTAVLSLFLSLAAILPGAALGDEMDWEMLSRENAGIRAMLFSRDDPREIFAGSGCAIIHSSDLGFEWQVLFTVKGSNKRVNALKQDETDRNILYAATGEGLFYSPDKGRHWKRLYRGRDYSERECTAVEVFKGSIYLGTGAGLLISRDKGRSWRKVEGELGRCRITAIVIDRKNAGCIYAVSATGVYRSVQPAAAWDKVYGNIVLEDDIEVEEAALDSEENYILPGLRYLAVCADEPGRVYLATARGVYQGDDSAKDWQALTGYGLLSSDIRFLAVSQQGALYALSKAGIFSYDGSRWHERSSRLSAGEIFIIGFDSRDDLYAGCEKGLYKAMLNGPRAVERSSLQGDGASGIPAIKPTQQAAIAYAEVNPEKIKQWRKQAAKKAWMPELSMGLARDTSDLFHWEGGSTVKADDDILRKGRDTVDWDIGLKWDLSEIIWNQDQTSIDVRSKLMVELRQDILDEVTKLYFERIRVKMELDDLAIEDRKKRFEKELKLQELTAQLDGFTGGYFSSHSRPGLVNDYSARR